MPKSTGNCRGSIRSMQSTQGTDERSRGSIGSRDVPLRTWGAELHKSGCWNQRSYSRRRAEIHRSRAIFLEIAHWSAPRKSPRRMKRPELARKQRVGGTEKQGGILNTKIGTVVSDGNESGYRGHPTAKVGQAVRDSVSDNNSTRCHFCAFFAPQRGPPT